MNAAAKVIQQSNVFAGRFLMLRWDAATRVLWLLIAFVLLSALAVVYVTNENRLSFMELQQLEQQQHAMQLHHGQLMLEQASLATAERIQMIAQKKLGMFVPDDKQQLIFRA
ncbi:MAG: cell division protein FtsL [Legionellaceae bacterium]|nr:cell division protein FtsL [Legionellaceae bacterium]